jgi:Domain of unknown function (DUF5753)/Helix-turn-helix domain
VRVIPDEQADVTSSARAVLRLQLGARLRRLREGKGIGREVAGWEIRGSGSKISRMELGRVSFKERDVEDLLTLYGVAAAERSALMALVRQANAPGWWQQFSDVLPPWFQSYLGLEEAASLIRTYEVQFVPGLLQTPEYARAVIQLGHPDASAWELDRRVRLRQGRRQVLERPEPPQLWAVMDEAVLHRPMGGRAVMRAQLEALVAACELPHIRLQVVPFRAGGHAAAGGPFVILRFPEPDVPDVVYAEQLTSAVYLSKRADVDNYAAAMEHVCVNAEPPDRTPTILKQALHDLGDPYS